MMGYVIGPRTTNKFRLVYSDTRSSGATQNTCLNSAPFRKLVRPTFQIEEKLVRKEDLNNPA